MYGGGTSFSLGAWRSEAVIGIIGFRLFAVCATIASYYIWLCLTALNRFISFRLFSPNLIISKTILSDFLLLEVFLCFSFSFFLRIVGFRIIYFRRSAFSCEMSFFAAIIVFFSFFFRVNFSFDSSVGIWTYGEQPCHQRLGPTGGSQKLMEACGWW